jgi:transcription elongation factor Elf1
MRKKYRRVDLWNQEIRYYYMWKDPFECPSCNSNNVYSQHITSECFCGQCGHEWKQKGNYYFQWFYHNKEAQPIDIYPLKKKK